MSIPTRPETPAVAFPPNLDLKRHAQRDETDVSLRSERDATDACEEGRAREDADCVVDLARARADAVLTDAREKADQDRPPGSEEAVAKDRDEAADGSSKTSGPPRTRVCAASARTPPVCSPRCFRSPGTRPTAAS